MPATNVVRIQSRQKRLVAIDDGPKTIKLLQDEIWDSGLTFTQLALDAQVCTATVQNIAAGTTSKPRMMTIVRLFNVLGWTLYAQER